MRVRITWIFMFLLGTSSEVWSQFSGYNLAEYQFGNIPGVEPADVHSIYDQLNLGFDLKVLMQVCALRIFIQAIPPELIIQNLHNTLFPIEKRD